MTQTTEMFAVPTIGRDFSESFHRNEADFWPYQQTKAPREFMGIPLDYGYAERLDPSKDGIPRASFYKLHPETVGQPIADRVADSLDRIIKAGNSGEEAGVDEELADVYLDWAESSFNEDNWTAAAQHLADVLKFGTTDQNKVANSLMNHLLRTVRSYSSFAPAAKRHEVSTPSGTITVAAGIKCGLDSSWYRDILVLGRPYDRRGREDFVRI